MDNPYEAPSSRVEDIRPPGTEPARRILRLAAAFIDGLILGAIFVPIEFSLGIFGQIMDAARVGQTLPVGTMVMLALIGIVVFVLVQGYPLVTRGQTWGKRACSIRIATVDDGLPSIWQLAIRYGITLVPGRVPYIGWLFAFVDICFIFREDRRCIHDLAAGTRVVNA